MTARVSVSLWYSLCCILIKRVSAMELIFIKVGSMYQLTITEIARKHFMVVFKSTWSREQHIQSWPKSDH